MKLAKIRIERVPNIKNRIKSAACNVQNAKRPGNSTKQALIHQEANAIAAVNAIECIHRNQSNTVIPKQPVCWQFACMWKVAAWARLDECSRSIHKVLPIGLVSTPPSCLTLPCQPRSKRLNWMSCTPSLARKKRDLRLDDCGSRHALCSKLGCGAGKNFGSLTSLSGTGTPSQTVLQ